MESGTEEVKVLQTVTLLLTSNAIVHGDTLARVRIYLHLNSFSFIFFNVSNILLEIVFFSELGALFPLTFYKRLYNNKYSWRYCKTTSVFGI